MNIALVLSGGTGTRLGLDTPKQYIEVGGKLIVTYCLETFINHNNVDGIWIVCADCWRQNIEQDLANNGLSSDKIIGYSSPGQTRQLSILNGLNDINIYLHDNYSDVLDDYSIDNTTIIIHDAARANLSSDFIDRCLTALSGHDGVMPVLPMKDTVYYSEDGKIVSKLLDRSKIYAGQAPELYKLKKYLEANLALLPNKILAINGSTEPAILSGLDVAIIPGDEANIKITTMADLEKFQILKA